MSDYGAGDDYLAAGALAGLRHALEVMDELRHPCLAPRDLLVGLMREPESIAGVVLRATGCSEATVREACERLPEATSISAEPASVPQSAEMADVWMQARFFHQALRTPIDSGVLLYLLSQQEETADVLRQLDVDLDQISTWCENARETGDPHRQSLERVRVQAKQAAMAALFETDHTSTDREANMDRFWKLWVEDSLEPSAVLLDNLSASHSDPDSLDRAIEKLRASQHQPSTSAEDQARLQAAIAKNLLSGDRLPAALAATAEAIDANRVLVASGTVSHRAELAEALLIRAAVLSRLSRTEDAIIATEEAVALYETLDDNTNDATAAARAVALLKLGVRHDEAGHPERGLPPVRNAFDIRRRLATGNPDRYRRPAAEAMIDLSGLLTALGRFEEAIAVTERALVDLRQTSETGWDTGTEPLGLLLNNYSLMLDRVGRSDEALAASQEAIQVLRRGPTDDLAGTELFKYAGTLIGAGRRLQKAGNVEGALSTYEKALDLLRRAPETDHKAMGARGLALNNCGAALAMLGRRRRAQARFTEAVAVRRELARLHPMRYKQDLSQSLTNLGSVMVERRRVTKGFKIWLEALSLPADIETRVALPTILLSIRSLWPGGLREAIRDAIAQSLEDLLAEITAVSLGTQHRRDRLRAHAHLAGIATEGAIFFALDRQDPVAALGWLDATTAVESQLIASSRSTELERLRETAPELAGRFEASVDHARAPAHTTRWEVSGGLLDDPDLDRHTGEPPATVIEEIRLVAGFEHFLQPRSGDAVVADLARRPTVVLLIGEQTGMALSISSDGNVGINLVGPDRRSVEQMVVGDSGAAASGQRALLNRLRLRKWASSGLLTMLTSLDQGLPANQRIRLVPVGLANWIPVQAVAALHKVAVDIALLVTGDAEIEQRLPFRPLVVHSHGDPTHHNRLNGAEGEARRIAQSFGVEPLTDNAGATPDLVVDRLRSATFVHLACHGSADLDDPDLASLHLGREPLTLERLNEALAEGRAPLFVGLSSCHSGLTERRSPEQAASLVANFLAHNARTVLAAQWEVNDRLAKAMALAFLRRWSQGGSASNAFQTALRHVAGQIEGRALGTSLEAFCLYGDGDLTWFGPPLDLTSDDERLDDPASVSTRRSQGGPGAPLTDKEEVELTALLAGNPVEPFRAPNSQGNRYRVATPWR